MEKYNLPEKLTAELDLSELNRWVAAGRVSLDWSKVKEVLPGTLEKLFWGLDLLENEESLGFATVPAVLATSVLEAITRAAVKEADPPKDGTPSAPRPSHARPAVWTPPSGEAATAAEEHQATEGEMETTAAADKGKKEETQLETDTEERAEKTAGERQPLLEAPPAHILRDELQRLVLQDLLGPAGGPEEELDEPSVRDRYIVGLLAPNQQQIEPEEQDELAVTGSNGIEDGTPEPAATQNVSFFPSSLGLSFCVSGAARTLKVAAHWGRYQRLQSEAITTATGNPKMVWKRQPMGSSTAIPLAPGPLKLWRPEPEEQPQVYVKGLVRKFGEDFVVTLFLVNGQSEPPKHRDSAWLFQPELTVEDSLGRPIFERRSARQLARSASFEQISKEDQAIAMLYRKKVNFAAGHGVSVHAETLPGDSTRAVRLSTSIVPAYEVPRTDAPTSEEIPALKGLELDMQELANTPRAELAGKLEPLVKAYEKWIKEESTRLNDPELDGYHQSAAEALARCTATLERIRAGIRLVSSNDQAARAFSFMNEAMRRQRVRTLYTEAVRRGSKDKVTDFDIPKNRSWRVFQLAFILLNIPSLVDLHHPDRGSSEKAVADLLWFPTGGGKTEAYLGLTAFTLAIRRIQGVVEGRRGDEGIAVLMRYTLRLLTLQQFQRAATLICACEVIRQEAQAQGDPSWGSTPFRLGLWVGQRTTPNTVDQSEEAIKQDRGVYQQGSAIGGSGTPRQLNNCPWCGSKVDYKIDTAGKGQGRTLMYCADAYGRCPFTPKNSPLEGIPALVVDEEIYSRLPSLLIATVDKFAQLPWVGATQMLFGQVDSYCRRHGFRSPDLPDTASRHSQVNGWSAVTVDPHPPLRPPDLIIQDELHLISGPLGSLVGLYESVVDRLCTWQVAGKAVRPKVIAASATVRRSSEQVKALFLRNVQVFPPQGIDVEDNFFSRQRQPSEETPGRRYLGICANVRRLKAVLIRVYVAQLAAAQFLYERYGKAVDPWMTLVGYFNSVNELAGMRRLVEDEVRSRLAKMDDRGLARRQPPKLEELTSRKSSTDIPQVLDLLEKRFDPALLKEDKAVKPLDVLLATNMISVGVDVPRLGLMVVAGQPKTSAEYIQASSRVGRNTPGLVCVVYNWARPRDLSHYEQFEQYHATFYQHVEPLSVTPFAPRALDRGLAALLVSYVRLLGSEFAENSRAGFIKSGHPYLEAALNEISERASRVKDRETGREVREKLEELAAAWVQKAATTSGATLGYKTRNDGRTIGLLQAPGAGKTGWEPFTCLNSLRDVEPSINLVLDDGSMGENPYIKTAGAVPTSAGTGESEE